MLSSKGQLATRQSLSVVRLGLLLPRYPQVRPLHNYPIVKSNGLTGTYRVCYSVLGKNKRYKPLPYAPISVLPTRIDFNALYYHTTALLLDSSKSLADKSVQILSESKKKEAEKDKSKDSNLTADGNEKDTTKLDSTNADKKPEPSPEVKSALDPSTAAQPPDNPYPLVNRDAMRTGMSAKVKGVWRRVVKELKHYYHGFRLLFIDIRICSRYVWNLLNGATLTRRERKQLVRTTADIFRLVPFSVFIIVPFMEFLLPVFLKLFPGMLPSTFAEADKEKESMKKKLKAKLEIAKFLQDTVEESAMVKSGKGEHNELAKEFSKFLKQIREDGTTVETADILKYTQLFKDEITLDNMSYRHLVSLCKLLGVPTIGTNKILVFQLRVKLRQLKADDKLIAKEGIGSLSESELQHACRARGMRALGVPEWRLRYQLKQWLDMHLNDKIPISLLLMSRALYLPENLSKEETLKTIISSLPENTTTEAAILAAEVTGERIDPAEKVKLLKAEEEAIAREKAEEAESLKQLTDKKAAEKPEELLSYQKDLEKHTIVDKAYLIEDALQKDLKLEDVPVMEESKVKTPVTKVIDVAADSPKTAAAAATEKAADKKDKKVDEDELTSFEIEHLEDVLEHIAEQKKIDLEKSTLEALREDFNEYQEDLSQLKSLVEKDSTKLSESKSAKRLSSAVNRMINNLSTITEDLHRQKQQLMEEIEVKQVKMKRSEELQKDEKAMENLQEAIQKEKDDVISINELVLAMKRIQKLPDDTRLQKIAEVLDADKDGQIEVSHVLRVLQELGTENVAIKSSMMKDIIELLKKEADIEHEEKLNASLKSKPISEMTEEEIVAAAMAEATDKLQRTTDSKA